MLFLDMAPFVQESLVNFEFRIKHTKAIIEVDRLSEAEVGASQVRQLFQNLIGNSLKYVNEGGGSSFGENN
jgi:light-regulated signal transduction histidine kinase (bacteriophytochrome)